MVRCCLTGATLHAHTDAGNRPHAETLKPFSSLGDSPAADAGGAPSEFESEGCSVPSCGELEWRRESERVGRRATASALGEARRERVREQVWRTYRGFPAVLVVTNTLSRGFLTLYRRQEFFRRELTSDAGAQLPLLFSPVSASTFCSLMAQMEGLYLVVNPALLSVQRGLAGEVARPSSSCLGSLQGLGRAERRSWE